MYALCRTAVSWLQAMNGMSAVRLQRSVTAAHLHVLFQLNPDSTWQPAVLEAAVNHAEMNIYMTSCMQAVSEKQSL